MHDVKGSLPDLWVEPSHSFSSCSPQTAQCHCCCARQPCSSYRKNTHSTSGPCMHVDDITQTTSKTQFTIRKPGYIYNRLKGVKSLQLTVIQPLHGISVMFWTLPADCRQATRPPAATPPPLATAAVDIKDAAMDPAAIPPAVKPIIPRATGAMSTAVPVTQNKLN